MKDPQGNEGVLTLYAFMIVSAMTLCKYGCNHLEDKGYKIVSLDSAVQNVKILVQKDTLSDYFKRQDTVYFNSWRERK